MNYQKLFNKFNDRFFESELPEPDIMEFDGENGYMVSRLGFKCALAGVAIPQKKFWIIGIDYAMDYEEKILTLIHEMIHIWQGENNLPMNHGKHFKAKCLDILEEMI